MNAPLMTGITDIVAVIKVYHTIDLYQS